MDALRNLLSVFVTRKFVHVKNMVSPFIPKQIPLMYAKVEIYNWFSCMSLRLIIIC